MPIPRQTKMFGICVDDDPEAAEAARRLYPVLSAWCQQHGRRAVMDIDDGDFLSIITDCGWWPLDALIWETKSWRVKRWLLRERDVDPESWHDMLPDGWTD